MLCAEGMTGTDSQVYTAADWKALKNSPSPCRIHKPNPWPLDRQCSANQPQISLTLLYQISETFWHRQMNRVGLYLRICFILLLFLFAFTGHQKASKTVPSESDISLAFLQQHKRNSWLWLNSRRKSSSHKMTWGWNSWLWLNCRRKTSSHKMTGYQNDFRLSNSKRLKTIKMTFSNTDWS